MTAAAVLLSDAGVNFYVLDFGARLQALAELDTCLGLCPPEDTELLNRILDVLTGGLGSDKVPCLTAVLADNFEGLLSRMESSRNYRRIEDINRLISEGPDKNIFWVIGQNHRSRHKRRAAVEIFSNLVSPADCLEAEIPLPDLSDEELISKMEFLGGSGKEVKIAGVKNPAAAIQKINAQIRNIKAENPRPQKLKSLPVKLSLSDLTAKKAGAETEAAASRSAVLPFGVSSGEDGQLETAFFDLAKTKHLLIAGPPGSGRTTALLTLAAAADKTGALVLAVCSNTSRLVSEGSEIVKIFAKTPGELDELEKLTKNEHLGKSGLEKIEQEILLLVDDAETVDDADGILYSAACSIGMEKQIHIAAAGRNDLLHRCSDAWIHEVRTARCGLLLKPDPLDGDLLGFSIAPEKCEAASAGRGRAVMISQEGQIRICQIAVPSLSSKVKGKV